MDTALEQAKQLLTQEQASCVIVGEGKTLLSREAGVAPLLDWIAHDPGCLRGCCMADKVVGKAAALLAVFAGVRAVYARLVSDAAAQCLAYHQIPLSFEKKVPLIENRRRDGLCPMEQACLHTDDAQEAFHLLMQKTGREPLQTPQSETEADE